ncbi:MULTISPECIES: phenylalanine--tRNA ligase subunit beta [Methanosphaera]|uniref:Phenylalanine--tRNA ligase beta subunit n=1 Tax=Methanosphaera stadtmanae (strain ATCC 43021 / DSM 3091 / JCM 11832 / MCB-3) TaxID=339860 RepID=SYFB_METST|nr:MULTISPECIES: phenylalanine--tRNA ligase subunit beta [Methanosphaera]Q2NGX9.1 RecName: Full=Phenylalanine--tRNA ligase beta subunit; AltName: Full=Phenylalanyl-tRNA synthetase beta subunit; Short=PheRS [Methanosphaera stadtmanae DSM 3091]ABC56924.1 PheT [Methanosphaera stadtmanae DSM 3091]MEE0489398.1 phenylalanine--tRNA ligase subunit beta [Methanosphaera stadtmanae]OEC91345.1 phenylalanine--tRNA ligase subunit beta [Methanosphaera sp. A6]RAP47938.1 MAG: phenylalanine--tRNA ligase subunit
MPVINFTYEELFEQLGEELPKDELINILPMISSDVESYDDVEVKAEFFPNRPDYYSVEGIVRSLKGYLELEKGIPEYDVKKTDTTITVDSELENIRPYVACCMIKNVKIDDNQLRNIMEFQEHLHWVIGRDRKKVAIGIHDLDKVEGPFYYKAGNPNETSFIPLESRENLTLNEILENHEKGEKYAKLLKEFDKYPLIVDGNGNIMSMPPIINSELTKLTTKTTNLFIDVTGTDINAVTNALNIIAANLSENGATIETIEVNYPYHDNKTYPDFEPKIIDVHTKTAQEYIGIDLTADKIVETLEKTRFNATKINEETVRVTVPRYRIDILHEVDIIENIALGYGFNELPAQLPDFATVANPDSKRQFDQILEQVMIGLSFTEIKSLMLTSETQHYTKLRKEVEEDRVTVAQPITQDRTMIRKSLINSLLEFLEDNKHEELPQKIFEIGDVAYINENAETKMVTVKKLAAAQISSVANFTTIKSIVESFVANMGFEMELEDHDDSAFIKGRCAKFTTKPLNKNTPFTFKGYFGEIHPEVLTNFELEYPVIAFEVEFSEVE